MTQFELLMDDMKASLELVNQNKKIFIPALIANILFVVIMIVIMFASFFAIFGVVLAATDSGRLAFISILIMIIIFFILALVFAFAFLVIEVGIIQLVITVLDGSPVTKAAFFQGVKKYIVKVFFTNLLLSIIYVLGFIILLAPYLLYFFTVGILSGGWGMLVPGIVFSTLLGYWILILMNDEGGVFESIGKNIRFGKKHFKLMAFLLFLQTMISVNFPVQSGLGLGGLTTIFISYALSTYFKMVILKTYRRLKTI